MSDAKLTPEIVGPRNERVTVREGVILFARILLDESCGNLDMWCFTVGV